MHFLILLAFLTGCANIRHATSTSFADLKSFKTNHSERDYWNKKVSELQAGEEKECKPLGEIRGLDNAFDTGPEYAVLYMKVNAYTKYQANGILVEGNNKVGDYGNEAFGQAFQCTSSAK